MTFCKRTETTLRRWSLLGYFLVLGVLPALAESPSGGNIQNIFQWRPFLAPFHAVVLHFPIGFLTMAFLLEVYHASRPSDEVRRVTALVLWLGLLTGIISATFGILRGGTGSYEVHALSRHRVYGLAVPIFTLATLVLHRLAVRNATVRSWTYGYRSVLMGTLALVVMAGHFGGNLTHGSQYLVANAPKFVRDLVQVDPDTSAASATAFDENQRLYRDKVQPIFSAKCYGCHGAEKQKGGFRLDQSELAIKGGESGKPAIISRDPFESHLVRLLFLPSDHDDIMPPAGKPPLTLEEIITIVDWIRNGAAFPGVMSNMTNISKGD